MDQCNSRVARRLHCFLCCSLRNYPERYYRCWYRWAISVLCFTGTSIFMLVWWIQFPCVWENNRTFPKLYKSDTGQWRFYMDARQICKIMEKVDYLQELFTDTAPVLPPFPPPPPTKPPLPKSQVRHKMDFGSTF